jgi:hypothetical protein
MSKKILLIFLLVIASLTGLIVLSKSKKTNERILSTSQSSSDNSIPSPTATIVPVTPADKIEVVHFHGTQQCWSCITVGEYALKTIKEKFPKEYASGKIVYKDINGELKENQDIVVKYQARGSSLFVNAIQGDKDNIAEDTTVWRLVNSESQFINYFENKLNSLLGK